MNFTKLSSDQISVVQFLHPRSAKSRGALLQLLSKKLKLQHRKVDIDGFTLLNSAFQVTFFFLWVGREESMLKAAMANWQILKWLSS